MREIWYQRTDIIHNCVNNTPPLPTDSMRSRLSVKIAFNLIIVIFMFELEQNDTAILLYRE